MSQPEVVAKGGVNNGQAPAPKEPPIVMCHQYPELECLDPDDCPNVYAKCWEKRMRDR